MSTDWEIFFMIWGGCSLINFISMIFMLVSDGKVTVNDLGLTLLATLSGPIGLFVILKIVFENCGDFVIWKRKVK